MRRRAAGLDWVAIRAWGVKTVDAFSVTLYHLI